ncbi:hypothetical protein IFM62136_03231 [Aspergillus lentulus]|nr:hypothetical protein IFM62136_03231 [Aspergillus lentulus]
MSPKDSSMSKKAKSVAKKGTSLAYRLVRRVKRELTRFGVGERVVNVVEDTIHDVVDQEESATSSHPKKPRRTIPATALDYNSVRRYFKLSDYKAPKGAPEANRIWAIPDQHLLPIPQHLEASMHEFDTLTRFSDVSLRTPAEAMGRSIIDQILSAAMREVRKELQILAPSNEEHLYLTMETRLEVTLSREDEDLVITGDADYSFWYGNPSDISTNLVVCEAKRKGEGSGQGGQSQLLGYMGR